MAGVGNVYGERSDGVCVPNEEVLQCVCTVDDRVEAVEREAGHAALWFLRG